jgi:hypothetical protein
MSFSEFKHLTIQADGYTDFAAALLVVDFIMVQTHFWTMLKHDPSAIESTAIKVFSGLSIAAEFLVLTPLFFISKIDEKTAIVLLLVVLGFTLVQFFCFMIAMIKTWMIHARMFAEGRITSHETLLKIATAFIFFGSLGSFLLGALFSSLIGLFGLCMYLHVLNVLRKHNGPQVTSRMFWAQIAAISLNVIIGIVVICMVWSIAGQVGGNPFNNSSPSQSTSPPQLTEDQVIAIWNAVKRYFIGLVFLSVLGKFLKLLTTGHFIGDACGQRSHDLNFQAQIENGLDDDFEAGNANSNN